MRASRRVEAWPILLLNSPKWGGVGSITPRPLYSQLKSLKYPLNRRLGGPKGRFEHFEGEKNLFPLPGFELGILAVFQPLA